jgi:hypothetical protein
LLVIVGCGSCCRTDLVGSWQCSAYRITVYEDGVASFGGIRASWSSLGNGTIRLEYKAEGESLIAELSLRASEKDETAVASLDLAGLTVQCDQVGVDEEDRKASV